MIEDTCKIWGSEITIDISIPADIETRRELMQSLKTIALHHFHDLEWGDDEDRSLTISEYERRHDFPYINPDREFILKCNDALKLIRDGGRDIEIKCMDPDLFSMIFDETKRYVAKGRWSYDIGGSPVISTLAEMHLNPSLSGIGNAYYLGNLNKSALDIIVNRYGLFWDRFNFNKVVKSKPRTLSIEDTSGKSKIMISYPRGRMLSELDKTSFEENLKEIMTKYDRTFLCLGGLNKGTPDEYANLLHGIRPLTLNRAGIFVGASSFKSLQEALDLYYIAFAFADVASYNESELRTMYTALGGDENKGIAEMLQDMERLVDNRRIQHNRDQLVICHSEAGAIARYRGSFEAEVKEALDMACSGASYRYMHNNYGREKNIMEFGKSQNRAYKRFGEIYSRSVNDLPDGIIGIAAPDFSGKNVRGSLVGVGATFDGILLSYITPWINERSIHDKPRQRRMHL